jgi:hypothetical protein
LFLFHQDPAVLDRSGDLQTVRRERPARDKNPGSPNDFEIISGKKVFFTALNFSAESLSVVNNGQRILL